MNPLENMHMTAPEIAPAPAAGLSPRMAAERAAALLQSPAAAVAFGTRPADQRRQRSFMGRVRHIAAPLVTIPLVTGAAVVVGSMVLGTAAGALIPAAGGLANGVQLGVMGSTLLTGPAITVASLVGLMKTSSRARTSLREMLSNRRARNQAPSRSVNRPPSPR